MTKVPQLLKVSSTTKPQTLAGAIAKFVVTDRQDVEVQAIGAGALSQAVKGCIMARRFVSSAGMNLGFIPAFRTLQIDGKDITAVVLIIVEL